MFSLLFGLWKYLFSKAEFHVLILGVDKAGKTTLLERVKSIYTDFEGLPPDRIVPTVGLNIGRVEAHKAKLIFWDLGGQIGLRTIWEKYFEEAHAVLYVVDSAGQNRFEDVKGALEKVLRHEDLYGAPVLVMANKQIEGSQKSLCTARCWQRGFSTPNPLPSPGWRPKTTSLQYIARRQFIYKDLPGACSSDELSRMLDLGHRDDRPCMVKAVCAYDGSGVRDGVMWLVEAMRRSQRAELLKQRADAATIL